MWVDGNHLESHIFHITRKNARQCRCNCLEKFWTEPEIPQRIKEFVRRIVPDKFRKGDLISDRGRILTNDEFLTPDEILKTDKLFKVMRVE